MDEYRHHVSGFFGHCDQAESAFSRLVEMGLPREQLQIFKTDSDVSAPAAKSGSNVGADPNLSHCADRILSR